jgi:hypothetical protein
MISLLTWAVVALAVVGAGVLACLGIKGFFYVLDGVDHAHSFGKRRWDFATHDDLSNRAGYIRDDLRDLDKRVTQSCQALNERIKNIEQQLSADKQPLKGKKK